MSGTELFLILRQPVEQRTKAHPVSSSLTRQTVRHKGIDFIMSRALLNKITLALTLLGCLIALVLTYEHFVPAAEIGCGAVGGDCHGTIESKYGKVGPIPTSIIGLGMYITLAGICILRARSKAENDGEGLNDKHLGATLFGISLLALCISWWLQYTSLFELMTFCPWCFASALTVTAIFLVSAYDHLILGRAITGEQKMLTAVVLFIGVMLSFVYAPAVMFQWQLIHKEFAAVPKGLIHPISVHPREELLRDGLDYKGKPDALYTIVEFADYQCPHCQEASAEMDSLLKRYPDRYRLAFRNYPLGKFPWSLQAAVAVEAAGRQGKFWQMHDSVFEHQKEMDVEGFMPERFPAWAQAIGVDTAKFKKDMMDPELSKLVQKDHYIGQINNMKQTPSFFIVPADPKGKIMMITGLTDAKVVLNHPNDPFWSGDDSSLVTKEGSQ